MLALGGARVSEGKKLFIGDPVPEFPPGVFFGVFAGVAGAWVRRIASRRMPPGMALVIGILAGGVAGAAFTAVLPNQGHRMALIATAAAIGALTPWIATWRLLADGDDEDSTPSDPSRPSARGDLQGRGGC